MTEGKVTVDDLRELELRGQARIVVAVGAVFTNTRSTYQFECLCGKLVLSQDKLAQCPNCKRLLFLDK